uniref:Uncharacterized protein n=2 Tax=Vibrio TaxID=662 RepID=A0A0H3ZLQ5_9VIBR|nr:hypothetical protein [Vibrio cyclitrophicus]AKN38251.1 hypothetical protein [Vibrio splendidus]
MSKSELDVEQNTSTNRVRLHRQRRRLRGDVDTLLSTSLTEKKLLKRAAKRLKYGGVTEFVMDCCKQEAEKVGITLENIASETPRQ